MDVVRIYTLTEFTFPKSNKLFTIEVYNIKRPAGDGSVFQINGIRALV